MNKLVTRITVVDRDGSGQSTVVYRRKSKRRKRVSTWSRPFEEAARHLLKAQEIMGREGLRRHKRSNRRRRDGWVFDLPVNLYQSNRRAYNEARKAAPFRFLPKA